MPKHSYEEMVRSASRWLTRAQYELDTIHFLQAKCDESSLLFEDERSLEAFVEWSVKVAGFNHFGSVTRDGMAEMYEGESHPAFDVRFEFIKPFGADWRIEAMCVLDGNAPLHEETLRHYGNGSVVHVSWRAAPNKDLDGYMRHRQVMEHDHQFAPLGEYQNSYGRFCYYGHLERPPFFKPRVNLRDA